MMALVALIATALPPTPELVVQSGHSATTAAISVDRNWLVTGGGQSAKIWDIGAGRLWRTFMSAASTIEAVALSPDKKLLATSTSANEAFKGDVSIFRTDTGERVAHIENTEAQELAFLPDGGVAAGVGKVTQVFSGVDGAERYACLGVSAVIVPKRKALWTVSGTVVRSCSLTDGAPGPTWGGATEDLEAVAASPAGDIIAAISSRALYLWNAGARVPRRVALEGAPAVPDDTGDDTDDEVHAHEGRRVVFLAGNQVAVATAHALWHVDARTGAVVAVHTLPATSDAGELVALHARGLVIADGLRLLIVDPRSGVVERALAGTMPASADFSLSHDGRRMLTGIGQLWDMVGGKVLKRVRGGARVAFVGDETRYLVIDDKAAAIVEIASGRELARFEGYTDASAVSADGFRVALAKAEGSEGTGPIDERIVVVDVRTLAPVGRLPHDRLSHIDSLALSARGDVLAIGTVGMLYAGIGVFTVSLADGSAPEKIDTHTFQTRAIAISPHGTFVASAGFGLAASVAGVRSRRDAGHDGFVTAVAFHPKDDDVLATGGDDGVVRVTHTESGALIAKLSVGAGVARIVFSADGSRALAGAVDGTVHIFDVAQQKEVAVLLGIVDPLRPTDAGDFVAVLPEGTYRCSRGALTSVAFRLGGDVYPFEQFDLRLNRPHEVLRALGLADDATIKLYRAAWQRRIERMGAQEEKAQQGLAPPTVRFAKDPPTRTTMRTTTLSIDAADTSALARVRVFLNDVPVSSSLATGRASHLNVAVVLSRGRNKIQLVAVNAIGVESLRATRDVDLDVPDSPRTTWVVALGVSTYADASMNLQFAAKDATDVVSAVRRVRGPVEAKLLTDAQVTRASLAEVKSWLAGSAVDDNVILFVAGHGLLDERSEYVFAAHDVDFDAPAMKGIPYDEIEGLLDGIPARHKLLLMDTCHAGELDDRTKKATSSSTVGSLAALLPGARGFVRNLPPSVEDSNLSELLRELFADLRRDSGAVVIASAGGLQVANEARVLKNGFFTYALVEGVTDGKADLNRDGRLTSTELRDFVTERVLALSNGAQRPTTRREQVEFDFEWPR